MPETATKKLEELEERVETLEIMMNEDFKKKVEEGLKDEKEGNVISIEEYLEDQLIGEELNH